MSEGGINIYPGYTGILCLYHHITKHVIVQWTGLDGVDQQAKLDTEDNLLSFFKATVDVCNEVGIDNRTVDDTIESNQLSVEVVETHSLAEGGVESGQSVGGHCADVVSTEEEDFTDINSVATRVKDEPSEYKPADIELVVDNSGMKHMCPSPVMMEDTSSNSVVEESVLTDGESISTDVNTLEITIKDEPTEYQPEDVELVDDCGINDVGLTLDVMEDTTSASVVEDSVPTDGGSTSTETSHHCPDCGKQFQSKSLLVTRERAHGKRAQESTGTDKTSIQCVICGKCFTSEYDLFRHRRLHTGNKPFECSVCSKQFNEKDYLDTHMYTHTNNKPYQCTVCHKCFTTETAYCRHTIYHTATKSHACSFCDKKFLHRSDLKRHLLTHTGERPYPCSMCDKRFAVQHGLKRHLLTHTGDRPYPCSMCDKRFTRKLNLKKHMKTHDG